MNDEQRALIEMQQNVISLVVKVSCLEELLIGTVIDKDEYEKTVKTAITKVNSIVADKIQEVNSKSVKEEETVEKE